MLQGGRQYAIDLISDEFDALLRVLAEHDFDGGSMMGDGRAPGNIVDYDGGLGSNSRLCVLVPEGEPSMYRVIGSAEYGYEMEGSYGLVVTEDPGGIMCPTVQTSLFQYNKAIIDSATEERFVDLGSFAEGNLSANEWRDPVFGVPMQVWRLRGAEVGDTVVVVARSESFAPEIFAPWGNPRASVAVTNECSAFVTLALPAQRDEYTLVVHPGWRSVDESAEGAFSVGAFPASEWEPPESCEETVVRDLLPTSRTLRLGHEVESVLASGGREIWRLETDSAQMIALATESAEFDAKLSIYRMDGTDGTRIEFVAADDDGGMLLGASRVELTTRPGETYLVVVESYYGDEGGLYRLRAVVDN